MSRRVLLSTLLGFALAAGCAAPPSPIAFEDQGKPKILRCTLRPSAQYLKSANDLAYPATVRAGSPAEVRMYSQQRVDLNLNKIDYQMFPASNPLSANPQDFMKKFFVNTPEELGLDRLAAARRSNIQNGMAEIGMTKEEAYATLGPPLTVDFGIDATNLTYETIMDRNRWVYGEGLFGSRIFMFNDNKLTQIIP